MKRTIMAILMVLIVAMLFVSCDNKAKEPEKKTEESKGSEESKGYKIGDEGPSGGYIFYVNPNYEKGSTDSAKNWKYLEAAPADLDKKYIFGYYRADGSTNATVGTSTAIGTGKANTETLVEKMGNEAYSDESLSSKSEYAAKACDDYTFGGYSDWFMPSDLELQLMYTNLQANGKGGFKSDESYLSSSEKNAGEAYTRYFGKGSQSGCDRYNPRCVRPIRAFE